LKRTIEGTLRIQAYAIFPAVAALAALAPYIALVAFTAKWLPGVPLLYLLLVSTLVASVNSTLAAALNALGKPQVVLRFMFMWLILSWVLAIIFVLWLDTLGYAIADALVASTVIIVIRVFKRHQPISVLGNIALPLLAAAIAGAGVYVLSLWQVPISVPLLVSEIVGVFVIFVLIETIIDAHFRHDALSISRLIWSHVRRAGVGLDPGGLQSER
jgi:O-antigen/teichoic acid export membrane protein